MSAATARIVAYLGGQGSFSEEACQRFVPTHDLMPLADFTSVARAVCEGSADLAVLPIANSRVGPILAVHQLLAHPELRVVAKEVLAIRLHLLACRGSSPDTITHICSHSAALIQCAPLLDARSWVQTTTASTAEAARQVSAANDPTRACIGSDAAATIYGLQVLERDLQGAADNHTTFAIVERRNQFA